MVFCCSVKKCGERRPSFSLMVECLTHGSHNYILDLCKLLYEYSFVGFVFIVLKGWAEVHKNLIKIRMESYNFFGFDYLKNFVTKRNKCHWKNSWIPAKIESLNESTVVPF